MTAAAPAPRGWNALVAVGTAVLGFGLPFSSATVSIGMGLLAIALLLRPRLVMQARPWREPVMAIGLALFAYIAVRTLVPNDADAASWKRLNQYQELLLAPLLLVLWPAALHRRILFRAFIVGCIVTAVWYWAYFPMQDAHPPLVSRRISAGIALALAAYLLVLRAPAGPRKWPWLAGAAFLAATVLLAVNGRTGQLVLIVLAAATAWKLSPARWRFAVAVAVPMLLVFAAVQSPGVRTRIAEVKSALDSHAVPDESNSTSVRIQLLRITARAVGEHWVWGVGFARYAQTHEQAARALYAGQPGGERLMHGIWAHIGNPHDEYALQLVGGGIAALALFVGWLGAALLQASRAPGTLSRQLTGIVLAFALGCIFNSLLLDFMESHLYVTLLAWFLAEVRDGEAAARVDRVVVIATRQIGDVLLATPLIHAARARWPDARIDVIGFAGTLGILRGNAALAELIESPTQGWGGWRFLRRVWRGWDVALVTDIGDRAHLLAWAAARTRSGLVPAASPSNWWKRMLLDHAVEAAGDRGNRHVVAEKLDLLAPWSPPTTGPAVCAPADRDLPQDIAVQLRDGLVVVHAPSMWSYKQWPVAHFEALVRNLTADGRQVVLTGSASERDRECILPLRSIAGALDVSSRLDFGQLASLLRRAALYIGPDTSVSHLAAACGIPVIAILGPTNPVRWAPWPAQAHGDVHFQQRGPVQHAGNVTVVQSELRCVPCGRAGCEDQRQSRSDCLVAIGPDRVIAEARRLLK